jgi:hypothetical protein
MTDSLADRDHPEDDTVRLCLGRKGLAATSLVEWRMLARDGAELPLAQALTEPSVERVDVGETRDVEFVLARGRYRLVVGDPKRQAWVQVLLAQ